MVRKKYLMNITCTCGHIDTVYLKTVPSRIKPCVKCGKDLIKNETFKIVKIDQ